MSVDNMMQELDQMLNHIETETTISLQRIKNSFDQSDQFFNPILQKYCQKRTQDR